jgi:hypothetical protein
VNQIKILAFSDIHNNVKAVEKLRKREQNAFDIVIIAGDIGSEKAEEIFKIISDYNCPIFYIYGNWDNKLSYSQQFSKNCIHLHQKCVSFGGYNFAGFSGCKSHWGENPIAKEHFLMVQNEFSTHLQILNKLEKEIDVTSEPIKKKIEREKKLYNEYVRLLIPLNKKIKRRNEDFFELLETKKHFKNDKKLRRFEKEISLNEKKIDILKKPLVRLLMSKNHKNYDEAIRKSWKMAEDENRRVLIEKLQDEGIDFSKTFLITHDRLYKTHIDAPNLFGHIFGHRHGFKHTIFQGTNFINVSVLDDDTLIGASDSTYCILIANGSDLEVYPKSIKD